MAEHVFICYAREDTQFVLTLVRRLKERGVSAWLDTLNLRPGEDWDHAIDKALVECTNFLIVLSPDAVESREVRGELRTALDEDKSIVPVIYRGCQIPRQLRTIQYIDFSSGDVDNEDTLTQLIDVLGGGQRTVHEQHVPVEPIQPEAEQKPPETPRVTIPPSTLRNSIGMELVLIPAGEFRMGAEYGGDNEKPAHLVRLSRPFYLGKYPVTQAQWEAVMGTNPSHFTDDPSLPVENVPWSDVQEFLRRLSEKKGGIPYRLPTEAEWEYAARAGAVTSYCFGDSSGQLREYAWYGENSGNRTHPVGQRKPNAWGLCDVHGNVSEWIQDWYDASYYQRSPGEDPRGPEKGQDRVVRGGSWNDVPWVVRVSYRFRSDPGYRRGGVGFRCAQ
ncbi:MAG: SUMF1/EgtB/PvdO family nonheme iron enzyme [Deltaproteobacteria bacterium]|nr:SUMF1/EgtB/PvdO family nonheme iron enzyme [Deltaproteobacteria bacterium]